MSILQGSVLCRLLLALPGWVESQWQGSLLNRMLRNACKMAVKCAAVLWPWLQESVLYRGLMAACRWVGRQWNQSRLIRIFLNPSERSRGSSEYSLFTKLWTACHGRLCTVYERLKLERVFGDSVLRLTWIWFAVMVVLSPILPTMVVAALEIVTIGSLLLAFGRDRQRKLVFAPTNKYILLYALVFLFAVLVSAAPVNSLKVALMTSLFTLSAVVVVNVVNSRSRLLRVTEWMVLAGAVVSLYGMFQFVFRFGYQSSAWVDSDMFSSISFRVSSTFDNPNMLGHYLVLLIPLGGACLLMEKDRKKRMLWFGCCALMCVCMLLTFSRGAWLALLCAGLVFFVLINPKLLALAPFALVVLYFVLPDTIIQRFTSIGNLSDKSTSYRVYIWMGTLEMLKDYWLCGVGPGVDAFGLVYPSYSFDAIVAPHSHNLFLQIVSDAGICALVLFVLIVFWFVRALCAGLNRTKEWTGRLFQIAFLSGIGGFMVQAMTDFSFYNYRVMFLFWICVGLGMTAARWQELRGEETK